VGRPDAFASVAKIIAEDPAIDAVVPVITFSPKAEIRSIAEVSATSPKPVAILWTGKCSDDASLTPEVLVSEGHAVYRDALPCMKALRAAMQYAEFRRKRAQPAPKRPAGIDVEKARKLVKPGTMTEADSKALLACYGLPVTKEFVAKSADEAAKAQGTVALKISSPDIPHKTEAKAIRLGISGEAAVRTAFQEVMDAAKKYKADARIDGILVQEMVTGGHEILVGVSRDPTFGPVLTVGLGGIYVEILKDVAFRLPPVAKSDAMEMLRELKAWPLLAGARGRDPSDVEALAECMERVSWLAVDLQDRIAELDINPLRVLPKGVRIVDALVVGA
jgi:acyl-CoA synthetase (NDP forming)